MSRLSSPRASASNDPVTAIIVAPSELLASPRPTHLSPRPMPSPSDNLTPASPPDATVLSALVSLPPPATATAAIGLTVQLALPPAVPKLPAIDFPLYSSTSQFAPHGFNPSSTTTAASQSTARPRLRPFFRPSDESAARARPKDSGSSTRAAADSTSSRLIRSYRRSLPSSSLLDSLLVSVWPHQPTAHTAQSRSTYLSMLPSDERHSVELALERQLAETARLLLSVLQHLDELCSRPYDLSLHRIQPNQWPLPAHCNAYNSTLVAPLLSSVGLLRDGEQWIVGEGGVDEVRRGVKQAQAELLSVAAEKEDEAEESAATSHTEEAQLEQSEEREERAQGEEGLDKLEQEAEQSATKPAPLTRHKSIHSTPMTLRPMPSIPTTARHNRSTFKDRGGHSNATQQSPSVPSVAAAAAAGSSSYSDRSEDSAQSKRLSSNVAGDRRTQPVALPRTFLCSAPHVGAAGSGSALFTVQPAVLELGPLLVGRTYTASVLLTNTSSKYARYELLQPPASHLAPPPSSSSPPPPSASALLSSACRLHFAFRRGALSAGLSKPLTAVIRCAAVGPFESFFDVEGEGGTVRVSVSATCMDDEERCTNERTLRDRLNSGELGLTSVTALPGSLKDVQGRYGRVVEMNKAETEESKEQLLLEHEFSNAVLAKWRNKSSRL